MCNYIYTPKDQIMKELNQKLAQIQTELKLKNRVTTRSVSITSVKQKTY